MTRTPRSSIYHEDFFAWSQEQAAALRHLSSETISGAFDIEHVAEEIEDLGKRDLREVNSFLERLIEHLIKIKSSPGASSAVHWRSESRHFARSAADAFSPSMRQWLDMDRIWERGRRAGQDYLSDIGATLPLPNASPYLLDDLLSDDFDIDHAVFVLEGVAPL